MLLMTELTSLAWRSRLLATRLRRSSQTASGSPINIAAIISEVTPTFQPAPARVFLLAMFSFRRGLDHAAPAARGQGAMTLFETVRNEALSDKAGGNPLTPARRTPRSETPLPTARPCPPVQPRARAVRRV